MFGFSFGEFVLICVVALVAVGPQKLPGLLRTLGQWIRKARTMLHDMRAQSGIDEILRAEGLHGGLNELRHLVRSNTAFPTDLMSSPAPVIPAPPSAPPSHDDPYGGVDIDVSKEYPPEGADSYGALPDDLAAEATSPYPLPAPVDALAPLEAPAGVVPPASDSNGEGQATGDPSTPPRTAPAA
ncbi:MAG: Sec-independent protein translocase subunit TatA/TatB [Myxococcota bacterium]